MPVLIAILSVIKYNFVSYIYKIRYFIAHSGECKIVCVNRYCMNLLYAPYWGKQR